MKSYLIRKHSISNGIATLIIRVEGEDEDEKLHVLVSPGWDVMKTWEMIHKEIERRLNE